jgi:hypothetical protein
MRALHGSNARCSSTSWNQSWGKSLSISGQNHPKSVKQECFSVSEHPKARKDEQFRPA